MEGSGERQVYPEDEINLFDYFQVIWKRKVLIISIFLAAVISAAAISFIMTPVYRVSALISPGWINVALDGRVTYIDSNENIQFSIENSAFDSKIIETLKLDPAKYTRFNFKTKLSKGSNVIQVYLDTTDREKGKLILGELLNNLTNFYGSSWNRVGNFKHIFIFPAAYKSVFSSVNIPHHAIHKPVSV